MPSFEDIEIRISKNGEIFVSIAGASEQRLNHYKQFLEENVGPLLSQHITRKPDWERPAGWVESDDKEQREQELGHS